MISTRFALQLQFQQRRRYTLYYLFYQSAQNFNRIQRRKGLHFTPKPCLD